MNTTTMVERLARLTERRRKISGDQVLNAMPDPVFVVDSGDDFIYLNSAAENFFGGSVATLVGTNLQDAIPHDSPILSLVRRCRRRSSSMTEHGVSLHTPRIGAHKLSVDVAPLGSEKQGEAGDVVVVFQADTIADRIDGTILQQGAARSVSALSAMLGHEVKNPLSGIRGAAQLLESMIEKEDRALAQLIIRETDRIVKLVDKFEVFSENPSLDRGAVNIHEVLDHVIAVARAGFARGHNFKQNYDPSLPSVFGDRDQLVQVFMNLIKNAAEAVSPEDGEIVVSTAFRHGVRLTVPGAESRTYLPMVVSIGDNGPGIPEDLRPHLFDPFITTKKGGTGLGLALAAKLIADHGGMIDVESRPRRTVFSVMLPLVREEGTTHE